MIEIMTGLPAHTVGYKLSGKLNKKNYKRFVRMLDYEIAKEGKVNVLLHFDFKSADAIKPRDDFSFSTSHCNKIKRIALVGDKRWEKQMAGVCEPFKKAEVKSYEASQMEEAK